VVSGISNEASGCKNPGVIGGELDANISAKYEEWSTPVRFDFTSPCSKKDEYPATR
jgi:hypothetical protein